VFVSNEERRLSCPLQLVKERTKLLKLCSACAAVVWLASTYAAFFFWVGLGWWVACRSVELGCEEEGGKSEILIESLLVGVIKTGWES